MRYLKYLNKFNFPELQYFERISKRINMNILKIRSTIERFGIDVHQVHRISSKYFEFLRAILQIWYLQCLFHVINLLRYASKI